MFRMESHVFMQLCRELHGHGLRVSKYIGIQEMVAMFLYAVGHGQCNRALQERFQHSGESISRHFHGVLDACLRLAGQYIRPRDATHRVPNPKLRNDDRYWPFFKDAIGAIDGTHIRCVAPQGDQERFICRKGYTSQNVMAVCDWDMCFTFMLAGWEGSAHDARVLKSAISKEALHFPHPPIGKYYLVDAGYATKVGYIGPYKRERYHLPDFRRDPLFANAEEVFNYYHSSLRSMIERTFGVWKSKFRILQNMPRYSIEDQARIVLATAGIHNFIRRHSETDRDFIHAESDAGDMDDNDDQDGQPSHSSRHNSRQALALRDSIRDEVVRHQLRRNSAS